MKPHRHLLREDDRGISEVVGTILILGMTVSLFAAIIVWVTSIPTPQASTRLELDGALIPLKDNSGNWAGVNITITHRGGESMTFFDTRIYITITKASGASRTEVLRTKGTIAWGPNTGSAYGLIDGKDSTWNINERWSITNKTVLPADKIRASVIDVQRSTLLWSEDILGPVGSHPPLFLEKWADGNPDTTAIETPKTGSPFVIYAKVTDQDGNLQSVNATLTIFYGTPDPCRLPQPMSDDGKNGDLVAGDGIWTLKRECMVPTNLSWDGMIVLFSATDGTFVTTSRMTLQVVFGSAEGGCPSCGVPSGRPPNLRYNGLQGYNLFNATQWDTAEFGAMETRTFKANERVVVVVGSYLLKDAIARDTYMMNDPFGGGSTPTPVVYGSSKIPNPATKPSNLQAFRFYKQVNGYNVFIYRFDLNNASSTGINYFRNPVHPPFYWFARYSLDIDVVDSQGTRFNTTDAVNITDTDGYLRLFPTIETYSDSAYTQKTNTFRSTDRVYVAVQMFSIDGTTDAVTFGNVQVRDFLGGVQVFKSFVNGRDSIAPLCNPTSFCGAPPPHALVPNAATVTYRFLLNLSLTDGDPWVAGSQYYALSISYVHDLDETYSGLSTQLRIVAPLFRLDVVGGNADTTGPAWGTHDYGYYYENLNGVDRWRKSRYEYCGLQGAGACKNAETHAVAFLDGENDGDLDIADSIKLDNNNAEINYYRRQLDFDGNVVFTKFTLAALSGSGIYCNDIAVGDLNGDSLPEIVCGLTDGRLIYFNNDGTWTSGNPSPYITVDATRPQAIWGVTIGDFDRDGDKDIAVARTGGTVTYYLNLNGQGSFGTGAITDRWFAEAEVTVTGTVTQPDFLKTIASDDQWEQVQEALKTEPALNGTTLNPAFNTSASSWTYAGWENGGSASGNWQATGGNPGGLVYVQTNFLASQTVSGLWRQSFVVSGSTPYTATIQFDRKVSAFGGSSVSVYVFVDSGSGNPTLGTALTPSFTHTGTTGWLSSGTISVPASRLPAPGTYYVKIVARTTNGGSGGTTTVQFDNIYLNWTSTGGQASEIEHYWRIQHMPNRPLSTFVLRFEAHRSAPTDGDFFAVAYATDVSGVDPTTGTYTTILWVNSTTDVAQTYNFPSNLQNKVVWLRVIDTDHHVGNTSLDTIFVDQMYIDVTTSPIQPGSVITLPSTPGDAKAIDSDDQDGDGYVDVVVGTSNGKVYKIVGFAGGLQTPGGIYYTVAGGLAITGIKLANITSSSTGLEIVMSYGTNVRVISGSASIGSPIVVLTPATTATITALSAGDVDGDGDDDIVVATMNAGPALVYYRNLDSTTGLTWRAYNIEPLPSGTTIGMFDIDLGDGDKAQYLGR